MCRSASRNPSAPSPGSSIATRAAEVHQPFPYVNPEVDRLIEQSELIFDPAERDRLLAKINEIIIDDAPWVFIVHDLNPRAMSPKVKGFVQAQSWYQDLTLPWVAK